MSIITISRGTYSGGEALANCLADRLGYQRASRKVIVEAARTYGMSVEKLIEVMEETPSFWQRVAGESTTALNYVRAALCVQAREGNLVYHGHAGHLLLTGISHVIRVRVIADMEFRIKAAMERLRLGRNEAIARIKQIDKARARWTQFFYGVEWDDPSLYDVVLNLERMTIADACEIVAGMTKLDTFKPNPQSIKAMEDLTVGSLAWAALNRDPRTAAADVRVVADDGVVTVTGTTGSQAVVEAIPLVAGQVEGVKEVRCEVGIGSVYEPVRKPRGARIW